MGIRTPVSHNWAMTLGGLKQGVTPLDMAHAYQTFARKGKLVYGSLSPGTLGKNKPVPGPVGIHAITRADDDKKLKAIRLPNGDRARNKVKTRRVLDEGIANTVGTILQGVVKSGTAQRAQLGEVPVAGKTGTTENYGDAWFVGWTPQYTVAVWVGYPKKFQPMKTEFQGKPVAGGTYPAGIWKTFMERVLKIDPPPELKDDDEAEGAARRDAGPRRRRDARPGRARPGAGGHGARDRRRRDRARPARGARSRGAGRHPARRAAADRARGRRRRDDAAVGRHGAARARRGLTLTTQRGLTPVAASAG